MPLVLVRAPFTLDTEAALGPQLVAARGLPQPVEWKPLALATGYTERQLRRIHQRTLAGWRDQALHFFRKCPLDRTDKRRALGAE